MEMLHEIVGRFSSTEVTIIGFFITWVLIILMSD